MLKVSHKFINNCNSVSRKNNSGAFRPHTTIVEYEQNVEAEICANSQMWITTGTHLLP